MSDHYTAEDRRRLAPKAEQVKDAMLDAGWIRLEEVSAKTGIKLGTVASRLREITDREFAYLGLDYERRRIGQGVHEYRLFVRKPEQMPLFDNVESRV